MKHSAAPSRTPGRSAAPWRAAAVALVVVLAGLLNACASVPDEFRLNLSGEQRRWPGAPETARYQYLGQLTGEDNFISHGGGFLKTGKKVLKWIVGLGFSSSSKPIELQRPQGVTVDAKGRIYVTDVGRQGVFVFDPTAGRVTVWQWAEQDRRFVSPIGIGVAADGSVLVADADLHRIVRLTAAGKPAGVFGDRALARPTGLAIDPGTGRVYVADTGAHNIEVFDASGRYLRTIGGPGDGPGEFNRPTYLYISHHRLYVSDTLNSRIQVLDLDGKVLRVFGRNGIFMGDTPRPKGVAVDGDGNIYVVESYYDYLLVFNAQGKLLLPIGGTGNTVGRFYLPAGIWVDQQQRVYVADMFNRRVVIFQYLGGA